MNDNKMPSAWFATFWIKYNKCIYNCSLHHILTVSRNERMDQIFKARYTGLHFRNIFSFLQLFTTSFNESPLNLRVQFSSFLKFSFCSLPIFKHQKIYGIILSESSYKRHAFWWSPRGLKLNTLFVFRLFFLSYLILVCEGIFTWRLLLCIRFISLTAQL